MADEVYGLPQQETPAGSPVYRVAPSSAASTTTLPTVGSTPAADVWAEVIITSVPNPPVGSNNPSTGQTLTYFLAAKAGVPYYPAL